MGRFSERIGHLNAVLRSGRKAAVPATTDDALERLVDDPSNMANGEAEAPNATNCVVPESGDTAMLPVGAKPGGKGNIRIRIPPNVMESSQAAGARPKSPATLLDQTRSAVEAADASASTMMQRRYHRHSSAWALHPHHYTVQRWNLLIAGLLVVQAITLPLQLAFLPEEDLLAFPWIMWVNFWADLTLWLDIILRFFVQVQSTDKSHWISNFVVISRQYAASNLLIDVCSVLPIRRVISSLAREEPSSVKALVSMRGIVMRKLVLKLVSFHPLLRFSRVQRVWRDLQKQNSTINSLLQFTYVQNTLLTSGLTVLFTVHVMACVWASMAFDENNAQETTWFEYYAAGKHGNMNLYSVEELNKVCVYLASLYWAVFTLTGIGYGDVIPIAPIEYCIAILCMFVGAITWAWVVASIVSIMATMNQATNDHLQTIDCVNGLLRDNCVKVQLGRRLREFFTKMKDVREYEYVGKLIDRLSPELKIEVVYSAQKEFIEGVWWLKMIPVRCQFLVDLTQSMQCVLSTPNELIPNKQDLSYVCKGLCIHGGMLLSRGQVFGVDMLLENEALRKPYATLALTFLHLSVLTKLCLDRIADEHPDVQPYLRKAYVKFAVVRGLIYKAAQIRRAEKAPSGVSASKKASRKFSVTDKAMSMGLDKDVPKVARLGRQTSKAGMSARDVAQLNEHMDGAEARLQLRMKSLEEAAAQLSDQVRLLRSL